MRTIYVWNRKDGCKKYVLDFPEATEATDKEVEELLASVGKQKSAKLTFMEYFMSSIKNLFKIDKKNFKISLQLWPVPFYKAIAKKVKFLYKKVTGNDK